MSVNYGISDVVYGDDNLSSATCTLGDGCTLIASVRFNSGLSGVAFVRAPSIAGDPFRKYKEGECDSLVNGSHEDRKIYILFDNKRSVDALISQLEESRGFLTD